MKTTCANLTSLICSRLTDFIVVPPHGDKKPQVLKNLIQIKDDNQKKQELWKDSFVISLVSSSSDNTELYVVSIHGPVESV